jgi:nitrogen regulatory protein PII
MKDAKALFIVVNAGFAEEIVAIAREEGASGATIMNARGEGLKPQMIMGITIDSEKEIVLSVVEENTAAAIMEAVKQKAGIGTPAHGVCFYVPVNKMSGTVSSGAYEA